VRRAEDDSTKYAGLSKVGQATAAKHTPCPTPEEEDVAIALILVYVFVSGLVMVKLDGVKVHETEVLLAIIKYWAAGNTICLKGRNEVSVLVSRRRAGEADTAPAATPAVQPQGPQEMVIDGGSYDEPVEMLGRHGSTDGQRRGHGRGNDADGGLGNRTKAKPLFHGAGD
jgi:hypothetical protein